VRLFVALTPPEAVREAVAERVDRCRGELPPARWVGTANLHLTLSFLGTVEPGAVPDLGAALAAAFAPHAPLTLRLAGAGCFPPRRPARVAWVGLEVDEGIDRLLALQRAAAAAARAVLGLAPESRPYSPHLTLARPREPWHAEAIAAFTRSFAPALGESFRVTEGVLVESELGKGPGRTARYSDRAAFPLAGSAASAAAAPSTATSSISPPPAGAPA
jgi:RNA 2',3'-cyclic 3'-phosphodiesterase